MVTTTAWISVQNNPQNQTGVATIDSGETASLAIPCGGRSVVRIGIPTIDSANLTFDVTPYPGATARLLKDEAGNTITVTAGTGGFVVDIPELSGAYSFTIISSATQNASRAFQVQCVGLDPALALTTNPIALTATYRSVANAYPDISAGTAWTTANSPITAFTVTGLVGARVYGWVGATQLTSTGGTGTLALGTTGSVGGFIAATTVNGTTNFIANAVWTDTSPTSYNDGFGTASGFHLLSDDVIITIATNNMTAGAITLYCDWYPISADGNVVAA